MAESLVHVWILAVVTLASSSLSLTAAKFFFTLFWPVILIKHMVAYHHAVCLKFLKGNLREKPQSYCFFFRLSFEAEEIGDPINTAYLDRSDRTLRK